MKRCCAFFALVLALTGCAVATTTAPGAAPTPETMWTSPVSPLSPQVLPPSSGGAVIVYERDGGIAGTHDVWRIYPDGRVEAMSKAKGSTRAQVSPGVVNDAIKSIVDGGFFKLQDTYLPANRGADRFTYKLTVMQDGVLKTVTTMDATDQPAALVNALDQVNGLLQRAESQ